MVVFPLVRVSLLCLAMLCIAVPLCAQVPPGAILWLSADSAVVASADGAVSLWRDRSGHGNDARQESPAACPRLLVHGPNGLPALRFIGPAHMVVAPVFPVGSDYSLSFVVKLNDASAVNNVLSGVTRAVWFDGSFYPRVMHGGSLSTQSISSIPVTTYYNVVTMTYREGGYRVVVHVNGFPADSAVIGPNADSTIYLGAYRGVNFLAGDLAEVILYRRGVDEGERRQLEGYLLKKYAITLPMPYDAPAPRPLLWLKGDFGVVTSNGRVSRWLDASGNGNAAWQDSVPLRPTLLPNATFDLPALHFSGFGELMEAPPVFPTRSDYTLVFAVRLNNLQGDNNVLSGMSHAHGFGGTPYARAVHGDFKAQAISSIGVERFAFAVVTMTYRESRRLAVIHVNGIVADSEEIGTNLDSTILLGAFARMAPLCGDLAEVLLYRRELGNTERMMTERYLQGKYGIPVPPPPPPPLVSFLDLPQSMRLYPRGVGDSALVTISGIARASEYDSVYVAVLREGAPWKRIATPLLRRDGVARFELAASIHAELSEYRFVVGLSSASADTVVAVRDSIVCGDAILIDGQSNAIFGNGSGDTFEYCRTFGGNGSSRPRDTLWALARSDGFGGPNVGVWGLRMQRLLVESRHIPICILNGGVVGTSLEQHMRNDADPADLQTIYGSLLYRATKAGLVRQARAMIWYQGEANTIDGYYADFKALHDRWRADYPGLERIYAAQIRPGCNTGPNGALRELFRTLGDSLPDVTPFSVMAIPGHDGCHFTAAGYDTIGVHLYRVVARDLYGATDTVDVDAPDIRSARFTDLSHREVALLFSNARQGLSITPEVRVGSLIAGIGDAFLFDDALPLARSVRVSGDTVFIMLTSSYPVSTISYVPGIDYYDTALVYEGPWLTNLRGVGAFSFHRFPIDGALPSAGIVGEEGSRMSLAALPNPFTSATILRIILPSPGPVDVVLFDALGREVWSRSIRAFAGQNSLLVEKGALASGLYLCRVTGKGMLRSLPIIVR